MPSLIAWLDSTPAEQKAARELIAMFNDKESRDELGIGPIRDAFSDLLFPGTSVLQTRARYYLFIPWCYMANNVTRQAGPTHRTKGRANERALIKALHGSSSQDKAGLIGARAGVNVRNLPSDIYWTGMLRYGVREHRGSIGALTLPSSGAEGATELTQRSPAEWNRTVPPAPQGFPDRVEEAFAMTAEEASWLKERIVTSTQDTVLAHLLEQDQPIAQDSLAPWYAVSESKFEELHHARMFSSVMQGAALLYNLLIAERFQEHGLAEDDSDRPAEFRERLTEWHQELRATSEGALRTWDLERMWVITKGSNPNIQRRAQEFVNSWVNGLRTATDTADDSVLRALVEEREKRKGAQSRLKNEKMLAAWSGESGTGRLTYRWGTVKTIVNDIQNGLDRAGA
ncbi:hypothetical protein ncot_11835 [Nocardioides sp. JQ2195]|uniref:DUF6361 family protein n=1 Tax=Nocardioides sp. JQ2195 TaxID=2592334 RepID=UPI00143E30EC|nr:DUF6361 family protein [Nocardioides sp. JQ2195]QIX27213.1 hypothetical protein ncot_11835 [Nocardioides sp. JQ2195]